MSAATARISIMLVEEEGPGHIFVHLRHLVGVRKKGETDYGLHWWSDLFLCVWCMSVWISALFCLLFAWKRTATTYVASWLAMSMVAMTFWSRVSK